MLRSEFEQRVNYKVTEEEFKSINEMYMDTDLDKDDFCVLYNTSKVITRKVADVSREQKQLREEKIQLGYFMADSSRSWVLWISVIRLWSFWEHAIIFFMYSRRNMLLQMKIVI